MSKDESRKGLRSELLRLRNRNVAIVTSGGTFAGSLTFTQNREIIRLAPNAPGLLPSAISLREIENVTDLSSLSINEYVAFVAAEELNNYR
ncbi:hypothetical protein [Metabacillus sp. cB07]|uniref:hypothetical protein n=1 Tax=Metabacillus sp. cB07 TaxID=2806989 RepID=UPI00193A9373|nr:hypothetical protein [Metabacillus sp. cB07]